MVSIYGQSVLFYFEPELCIFLGQKGRMREIQKIVDAAIFISPFYQEHCFLFKHWLNPSFIFKISKVAHPIFLAESFVCGGIS